MVKQTLKILGILSFVFITACSSNVALKYRHEIIDLGILNKDSHSYSARSINNKGEVAGVFNEGGGQKKVFVFRIMDKKLYIRPLFGTYVNVKKINDMGQVLVNLQNARGKIYPFVWDFENDLVYTYEGKDSHFYKGSEYNYFAEGINNSGEVVGICYTGKNKYVGENKQLFIWDYKKDSMNILQFEPYLVDAVNNSGEIAGTLYSNDIRQAFLSQDSENIILLGPYPKKFYRSYAYDINDKGQIVGGWRTDKRNKSKSFLWDKLNGFKDLGKIKDIYSLIYGSRSSAKAINNKGQIVGWSSMGVVGPLFFYDDGRAFYFDENTGMVDLNDLVVPDKEWGRLVKAYDINDKGQIVGWGHKGTGYRHAFLIVPIENKGFDGNN